MKASVALEMDRHEEFSSPTGNFSSPDVGRIIEVARQRLDLAGSTGIGLRGVIGQLIMITMLYARPPSRRSVRCNVGPG